MTTRELRVSLNERAACKDADPTLFNATRPPETEAALTYCSKCVVTDICEIVIDPVGSLFDGVAAGKVWSNGFPIGRYGNRLAPIARHTIPHLIQDELPASY